MASNGTATMAPSETATPTPSSSPHSESPVVSFIIGFAIIMAASLMNAGGLNLTKLDHVRTMSLPKSSRRRDFLRPLWVLGMILYILSQLVGSSLALEYMRAEYVAPLGSSSLIFNFLFASLLIGTPVTRTDIYGTAVVILGVIGIVAFGSINSGLKEDFSLEILTSLWSRAGWISYFTLMTLAIITQYICNTQLEAVLNARSELSVLPQNRMMGGGRRPAASTGLFSKIIGGWSFAMKKLRDLMESWTASKDEKMIAWILGIGWSCNGGAMAGGSLVFAKAVVKLISGSLSHTNSGNQFVHPASIATIILLALSAVFQIICLNRGLKVYDSTLVVPTFYAVYTALGFLNSLIFMDEVDAYKPWTLFAIFVSIAVLIGGVVLLTNKKPEPINAPSQSNANMVGPVPRSARRSKKPKTSQDDDEDAEEDDELRMSEDEGERERDAAKDAVMWQIGADDEDDDGALDASGVHGASGSGKTKTSMERPDVNQPPPYSNPFISQGEREARGLINADDEEIEQDGSGGVNEPVAGGDGLRVVGGLRSRRNSAASFATPPSSISIPNGVLPTQSSQQATVSPKTTIPTRKDDDDDFGNFEEWDRTGGDANGAIPLSGIGANAAR